MSCQVNHQKPLNPYLEKKFLNRFHDWDIYSPNIREWVANASGWKIEKSIFLKKLKIFISLFHDWVDHLRVTHEWVANPSGFQIFAKQILGIFVAELATWAWLTSESQKCKVTVFFGFLWKFFKSKYFPKISKTLKNLCGFD